MAHESESDALERQADLKRAALSDAIDRLRDNLRPDNLAHEALGHVYGDGSAAMNTIGRATRDNPVPTALIGAGCAMLLGLGRRAAQPAPVVSTLPAVVVAPDEGSLRSRIRTRPLLFGTIGVAVGAALGALIA